MESGLGQGPSPRLYYEIATLRGGSPVGAGLSLSSHFLPHKPVGARKSGVLPVVKLRVRSGESIQEAVRRFRKLCERSGLRKEMRRKAYYEKPSERRRDALLGDLTRLLTYHDQYGYRGEAKRLYREMAERDRDWTGADLDAARLACPNRLDFTTLLPKIERDLA